MTKTLAHGYSSESTQLNLSNENQYDRVQMVFKKLSFCALGESILSIGRVKYRHLKGVAKLFLKTVTTGNGLVCIGLINPFTPRAAKKGQTILEIFYQQNNFLKKVWRIYVGKKPNNNSSSNIFWIRALFPNYFQKYESSRQYFLENIWVWMG